jgi:spermidine/putrescine transport system permease protein
MAESDQVIDRAAPIEKVRAAGRPSGRHINLSRWAVVPTLAWTAIIFAAPIVFMVVVSFWHRVSGKLEAAWDFANYAKFFGKSYLLEGLFNSIEVSLITAGISVILAYPLAYVLAYQVPQRWQKFLLVLCILPFWTSYLVRSYAWSVVLGETGVLNAALLGIGVIDDPIQLGYTRGATVLGFTHFFTMLLTLTIYANLVQISKSYRLAAADLGASKIQVFLRITLPLSIPGIAIGAFITFVITMGDYITPQILGGSNEMLLPQAIILQIQRAADLPMASAMSLMLMVAVTIAYFAFARWLRMDRV